VLEFARIDCQKLLLGRYHWNYYWIELVLEFSFLYVCRGTVDEFCWVELVLNFLFLYVVGYCSFTVHTHVLYTRWSASTVDGLLGVRNSNLLREFDCQKLLLGSCHRKYCWIELVLNFFIREIYSKKNYYQVEFTVHDGTVHSRVLFTLGYCSPLGTIHPEYCSCGWLVELASCPLDGDLMAQAAQNTVEVQLLFT
jgi:hypothetical protein